MMFREDLELKKKFHFEKNNAQEMYDDSIVQRRLLTRIPYDKLVSLGDNKRNNLAEYQEKNRMMEMDVNIGTLLKINQPKSDTNRFDDKENSLSNWTRMNRVERPSEEGGEGIIRHFLKK